MNKAQITEELERIKASSEFRNKPVMKRMLSYLVEEHLEGRANQLKGYTIAIDVFGQGHGFDPEKSALVRNNAVRLRGLLKSYYLDEGRSDPVRIDVPKGAYVPRIAMNGPSRRNVRGVGDETRVAVLPFDYESDDGKHEYIVSGLSQELADALTRFDDVTVIGVGNGMAGTEQTARLAEEVKAKRVDFLIGGTLKTHGDWGMLRVRLIDTARDQHVWEERFRLDLSLDNLFRLEEEISGKIASHVAGEYGRINQVRLQGLFHSAPDTLSEQQILLNIKIMRMTPKLKMIYRMLRYIW